jgi:hypothetical protein
MTMAASGPAGASGVAPEAGTARPRRRWIWVLVALATAGVIVVPITLRVALKVAIHHQFDPAATYQRDVTGLQVQADGGGFVTIQAGQEGRVTIASTLQWLFGKPAVTQSWHGRVLRVRATCPRADPLEDCQASVIITVPSGTAVSAQAGAGTVTVTGVSGPLHLAATSGVILVSHVSGPLWLAATSGSVAARTGVYSPDVHASVTSGDIALRLDAGPRLLTVGVGSGFASILLPQGSRYRIAGPYGPGWPRIATGLSDASSGRVLSVTIGTGAMTIGYPPQPPGRSAAPTAPRAAARSDPGADRHR